MSPPGLDLDSLGRWLAGEVSGAGSLLEATLIAGGKSNLTYLVTDGTSEWIVRRPPMGHVLATAHDMAREFRVMSALQDTAVPVPRTYAFCGDESVIGADFYVMERCAGTPLRRAAQLAELGPGRTRVISTGLVDTLAALHAVDPHAVGLGDFGRPEGFLARQVARWKKQLDASHTRDLPAAQQLFGRLAADVPLESTTGIVHGDFRLDNVLVDGQDRVTAVLDWEMATLGDPLTDLALMLTYDRLGAVLGEAVTDASLAPGYLTEDEILNRYAASSSRDLARFGWYRALAAFKLAAILEGIHHRFLAGHTVGEGFDGIADAIDPLLDAGLSALDD
ncbi:Predicted kinase, aminoglycoside phosphotransferase (APT) family [Geodermatophilus amargosae]|uniref:Predicted kinase, aminoglycoside phosphotransferase (APT) family n=1 Tax=Geodermatophilus amargosae TaxID=1296565 RepID=A0A1I7B3T8_9ACTN|nr:phosphotransferase family protein [Geodermatophilus amargosae]SFT81880.1 Predicted kinase, aminoglycoside phosphotransferase (APT) family [Geodermatophilus amargosae]